MKMWTSRKQQNTRLAVNIERSPGWSWGRNDNVTKTHVSVIVGKVRNRSSSPDNEHVFQTAEFSYRKTVSNISPDTQSTAWLNEPQQVFVQLRPSAVNTTLPAFAAEPLLLGARRCQPISPARTALSSKPAAHRYYCRMTAKTSQHRYRTKLRYPV